MNKYKTKEVIKMLEDDGWYIARVRGSHRQFKHPYKHGTVTVNGKPNQVVEQFILIASGNKLIGNLLINLQ